MSPTDVHVGAAEHDRPLGGGDGSAHEGGQDERGEGEDLHVRLGVAVEPEGRYAVLERGGDVSVGVCVGSSASCCAARAGSAEVDSARFVRFRSRVR